MDDVAQFQDHSVIIIPFQKINIIDLTAYRETGKHILSYIKSKMLLFQVIDNV